MNILICDDCQSDIDKITMLCKAYAEKNRLSFNYKEETNPQNLDVQNVDLLFLDIRMPGTSGIEIQRRLEFSSGKPLIIFVTNYAEYSIDSHGTNVIGFLEKPIKKIDLDKFLEKALILLKSGKVVSFGENHFCNTKQIQYIIMDQGISKAVLEDGQKTSGMFKTIRQWEEELKEFWFIRINKSCLVNCKYIKTIKDGKVMLRNGEVLTASRREKKCCEDAYGHFLEYHARFI